MIKKSIYLIIISLIVSVFSFFNQVSIAKCFGAGKNLDLYLTCTSFPLLVGALFSITLSYLLTPHLLKQSFVLDSDDNMKYVSSLFYSLFKRLLLVIFFFSVLSILFFRKIFTSYSNESYNTILFLLIISWLNTIVSFVFSYVSCYLNSIKSYVFPLVLNLVPFLFSILLINFFSDVYGILTIILGNFFGLLISTILIIWKSSINLRFVNLTNFESQKKFISQVPMVVLAMLAFTIYQSIDSFWVTKISVSFLSYLGYGQRILIAIGSLVIVGPSNVLVPKLTESFLKKDFEEFYETVKKVVLTTFALASFVAVLCSVFAKQIIFILLQRGEFTEIDTQNLSSIMPIMFLGMIFMLNVTLMFRILFIQEKQKNVAIIGVLTFLIYFIGGGIAAQYKSLIAFSFAYLVTWIIVFGFSLIGIYKNNLNYFLNSKTYIFFIKLFLVLIITVSVLFLLSNNLALNFSNKYINSILSIVIDSTIASLFFIIITSKILVIDELKDFYYKIYLILKK